MSEIGRLVGIARKAKKRAPMEELEQVRITSEGGLDGDFRGSVRNRAVTVLARESWTAALADLAPAMDLPWTLRRANLLVEGIALPQLVCARLQIGPVLLEIMDETWPCARMEEQHPGLRKALIPDWRGGVVCRVLEGGEVTLGDDVEILPSPEVRRAAQGA
ncbi:MAG: MOSC domain-containing protein [Methyloligellaceae bacterium]